MRYHMTFLSILVLLIALMSNVSAQNLLRNLGFEEPSGWSKYWTVRDASGGSDTYHYHINEHGGGHGDAVPYSGKNALEIYSTDKQTYLVQKVYLEPGTYRLSTWARTNGTPDTGLLELSLGDKKTKVPVTSQKYRFTWADFDIADASDCEASFFSPSYGIVIDNMSLEKIDKQNAPQAPIMYIDLFPGNKDKAANIQNCLKGSLQWVEFAVTCLVPSKMNRPVMRILVPEPVILSGLNEGQIHRYRMRDEEQVRVSTNLVTRDGKQYKQYSFQLPRFISGYERTLSFGGFWVSNVPSKSGHLIMEITDGENILAHELIKLRVIDPPKVSKAPKRYYLLGYAVQNWMMDVRARVAALPYQYKMMGFNVWSDYGLSTEYPKPGINEEEMVLKEAYEKYGFKKFWPNSSSFLDVTGGMAYADISEKIADKDMYIVGIDGKVNKNVYNFNYAANKGKAWMESSIASWKRTANRPIEMGLPYRYSGFINDGLEGIHYSYDPSTLAAFAEYKSVDVNDVTLDKLSGEWKRDWLLFNMDLYRRVLQVWADALRQIDPNMIFINTASTLGPSGFESLTKKEQMSWTSSVDYNMPQWYAGHHFGSAYIDFVKKYDKEKLYGKENGGTDIIPLLYLSMGGDMEDPAAYRFKILDFLSTSKSVKGIGYYIGTYAFSDAKFMIELSAVHTLLANIEDYYADGIRDDSLVKLSKLKGSPLPGSVRVHKLNKGKRVALITVIAYDEQNAVQEGSFTSNKLAINIDKSKQPGKGKGMMLVDMLTGKKSPLPDKVTFDTKYTKNVAVYEIVKGNF